MSGSEDAVVVVPLKSFRTAKSRLSSLLDPDQRADLVRSTAATVIGAADPLRTLVVCDDVQVADFARHHGATVISTPPEGLNSALEASVEFARAQGASRMLVVPGDLPFASDLIRFVGTGDEVVIVPDRHHEGTNLMSLPTGHGFRFRYGPGSLRAHLDEATRLGLPERIVEDEALAWDIDEPEDLSPPSSLGAFTIPGVAEQPAGAGSCES